MSILKTMLAVQFFPYYNFKIVYCFPNAGLSVWHSSLQLEGNGKSGFRESALYI